MHRFRVARSIAGILALVLGLAVLPVLAAAQDDIPEGAVDGALRSFSASTEDFSVIDELTLTVFEFEDEDAAEEARGTFVDDLLADAEESFAEDAQDAEFEEGDELDIADGGRVFSLAFPEEEGNFVFDVVVVRDGAYLYFWLRISASVESDGTPAATPEAEGPVTLVELAETWLAEDREPDGSLLDLLPTEDDLPEDYTLVEESEGLDALSGDTEDDATPNARRAA